MKAAIYWSQDSDETIYYIEAQWMTRKGNSWRVGIMSGRDDEHVLEKIFSDAQQHGDPPPHMVRLHNQYDIGQAEVGVLAEIPVEMVRWVTLPVWN